MAAWTEEEKAKAIDMYTSKNPTPENTMEIVQEVANELGQTVNGTRIILAKAEVYVPVAKKTAGGASSSENKTKRKSKAESLEELSAYIRDAGMEPDDAIISKMTGKAAEYFISVFKALTD